MSQVLQPPLQSNVSGTLWTNGTGINGFWCRNIDCTAVEWKNPTFLPALGYQPNESFDWNEIVFLEDVAQYEAQLQCHLQEKKHAFEGLIRYRNAQGNSIEVCFQGVIVSDASGNPTQLMGTSHDVTSLNEMQQHATEHRKYKKVFDSSTSWIALLTSDGLVIECNQTMLTKSGIATKEIQDTPFCNCLFWKKSYTTENFTQHLAAALAGAEVSYEKEVLLEDKSSLTMLCCIKVVYCDISHQAICVWEGKPIQDVADIRNRYRSVLDGSEVGLWEWNIVTGEITCDEKWPEILGYTLEEIGHIDVDIWRNLTHPDDLPLVRAALKDCFEQKSAFYETTVRMRHKNGEWIWIIDQGKVLSWSADGQPLMMFGTIKDVTNSRKEQESLRAFVEQAPTAIAMFDNAVRYIAVSDKWKKDYYLEDVEVIGKSHYEIFPEIGENWKRIHTECLAGVTHRMEEEAFERQDGTTQWLKWEVKPWYDVQGHIGGIIMYTEEISVKKEAEEKLRISEETFKGSFEYAAVGMARVDTNGHWLTVNEKLCEILGYTRQELDSLTFQDITHPDDLDADLKLFEEVLQGIRDTYQMEKRYIKSDGSIVYGILTVSVVRDLHAHVLYFVSQIIDITYLKTVEQQLSEALQKNQGMLDASTQVAIIGTDTNGLINAFNKGAENLLGYTADEILYQYTPVKFHITSEIIARGNSLSKQYGMKVDGLNIFVINAINGGSDTRQWTFVHKDGHHFPVLLTITAIRQNGTITGYLGVAADISQLKQAEQEIKDLLEFTQEQNDKLRNFAHIVAHNLRSHSSGISILLEMLTQDYPELVSEPILELLSSASTNLNDTIKNLTEIVEINNILKEKMHSIAIKSLIDKAIKHAVVELFHTKITIRNTIQEDVRAVAIPAYIESIVFNLVSNAVKYCSPERDSYLDIESYEEEKYIVLVFKDNGLGINLDLHGKKIFGMYKTFHGNSDARGIGLFMTKNQLESMGGKIEVESQEGVGTTFKIYLRNEKN